MAGNSPDRLLAIFVADALDRSSFGSNEECFVSVSKNIRTRSFALGRVLLVSFSGAHFVRLGEEFCVAVPWRMPLKRILVLCLNLFRLRHSQVCPASL